MENHPCIILNYYFPTHNLVLSWQIKPQSEEESFITESEEPTTTPYIAMEWE